MWSALAMRRQLLFRNQPLAQPPRKLTLSACLPVADFSRRSAAGESTRWHWKLRNLGLQWRLTATLQTLTEIQ
jgi:hypothetical protein